jgi:hypothetical protein
MRHLQPCWSSGDLKPEQHPDPRDATGAGRSLSRAGVLSSASATRERRAVLTGCLVLAGGHCQTAACKSPLAAMHVSVGETGRFEPAARAAVR